MSRCHGFTLVELMVVIAIFGFLMTMVTPAISTWQTKHRAEAEIEKLHGDLQVARMKAYTEKVTWGIWWGSGNNPFSRYQIRRNNSSPPDDDINDDEDSAPFSDKFMLLVNSSNGVIESITFDSRGFCNNLTTLHISDSDGNPLKTGASTDCLAVSSSRVRIGKLNAANECKSK